MSERTFDLPTRPAAYGPGTDLKFRRVDPLSEVNETNLTSNNLVFQFRTDSKVFWVPSESYCTMEFKLTNGSDNAVNSDGSEGYLTGSFMDNMLESATYELGPQLISRVGNSVGQVSSFKRRMTRSWQQRSTADAAMRYEDTLGDSISINTSNNNIVSNTIRHHSLSEYLQLNQYAKPHDANRWNAETARMEWQPPLGIFDIDHGIPGGQHRLTMKFRPDYVKQILEAAFGKTTAWAANSIKFVGLRFKFYAAMVTSPVRFDNMNYVLNTESIKCQQSAIRAEGAQQHSFIVDPSIVAMGFAFKTTGTTVPHYTPNSKFLLTNTATGKTTLSDHVQQFYVQYGGRNYPEDRYQVMDGKRIWSDTFTNAGMLNNVGGVEPYPHFMDKYGPIYYFRTIRDGSDQSNVITVNFELASGSYDVGAAANVYCFTISAQSALVQGADGTVLKVETQRTFGTQGSGDAIA